MSVVQTAYSRGASVRKTFPGWRRIVWNTDAAYKDENMDKKMTIFDNK